MTPGPFRAVVLAGGAAVRLDGADKAMLELRGRTLLSWALQAVAEAAEVVVVADPVPTDRPVTFTRESPRLGGPAAALLAGRDALGGGGGTVAVVAVDMPHLTSETMRRLRVAATGRDGAVLTGPDGRRQVALVLDLARLDAVRPDCDQHHGLALHRLLAGLDLIEVAATGREYRDVDTWSDVADLQGTTGRETFVHRVDPGPDLHGPPPSREAWRVNLHDWIDELADVLELEDVEVDEALLNDVAKAAGDNVDRRAAPVTAYLLGYAAGAQAAGVQKVEELAARAQELAESWDRPAGKAGDEPPADGGDLDYSGELDLGDGDDDDPEIDEFDRPGGADPGQDR